MKPGSIRKSQFTTSGSAYREFHPPNRSHSAIAAALLTLLAGSDPAKAFTRNVTFCNHSTNVLELAYGYDATGTSETTSRGWRQVAPCSCRSLFSADLRATEVFVLVLKDGTFDSLTSGRGPLCAHPTRSFKFISQNQSAASCQRAGGRWLNFTWVNAERTNHTIHFNPSSGPRCNL
jgi:uncharacterized membrane protein